MKSISLQTLFVFLTIIGLSAASYKWTKEKISNPYDDPPTHCGLESNGHPICDPEKQLDTVSLPYTIEKLSDFTRMLKCPCSQECKEGQSGIVVGLVIVKEYNKNELESNEANPSALQEFADHIRQKWNLGSCDNSILITIATEPKQYGISIGARAGQVVNDTWFTGIMEENFRERSNTFNLFTKLKDILFMFKEAISEEIKRNDEKQEGYISKLTDSNANSTWNVILIMLVLLVIVIVVSIVLFVVFRHRKENDDISIRDVWSKKFWTKAGNQYKEAKQSESNNEKDVEKNDDESKAKLASTEDLKAVDDINSEDVEYPGKLSKV